MSETGESETRLSVLTPRVFEIKMNTITCQFVVLTAFDGFFSESSVPNAAEMVKMMKE